MGRAMVLEWVWGDYSRSCDQSPTRGLSSTSIQVLASISWKVSTARAAAKPTPARIFTTPSLASSSSSSSTLRVAVWDAVGNEVPSGWVGGWSWTVALGRVGLPPGRLGAPAGLRAPVPIGAAEVARRMVGAGEAAVGAPAVRRGIVGAGADGRGAIEAAVGVGGAPPGTGGRTGGAIGTVADGTAGGASAALRVTRTVSFFRGTLDVCLDGSGGWFSFSLMRARGFDA